MTQKQAADAVGLSLRDLRRLEGGLDYPDETTQKRLAELLGANRKTLFGDLPKTLAPPRPRPRRGSGPGAYNPVDVHVGSRVFTRRTELDMSQERLAEALGVSFQQVQKYERGANRISASRLFDIARILGVEPNYFFTDMPSEVKSRSPGQVFGGWQEESERYEPDRGAMKEGAELMGAYQRIEDSVLRRSLIELAKAMAEREGS